MNSSDLAPSLQDAICADIPMAGLLGFRLLEAQGSFARSSFELGSNTNHLGTFFGGSLFSAAALTCYSSLLSLLKQHGLESRDIVIAKSEIRYLSPGRGRIEVISDGIESELQSGIASLRKLGKGRFSFEARIIENEAGKDPSHATKNVARTVAEVQALYVVKRKLA